MQDDWMEYTKIEGNSATELTEAFKTVLNEAFARNVPAYSQRWDAVLETAVNAHWMEEVKGEHFVCIVWGTMKRRSREEYLGEDDGTA